MGKRKRLDRGKDSNKCNRGDAHYAKLSILYTFKTMMRIHINPTQNTLNLRKIPNKSKENPHNFRSLHKNPENTFTRIWGKPARVLTFKKCEIILDKSYIQKM